jgi:hypothetical protein
VPALDSLPRAWLSVELPGFRPHVASTATYSSFAYEELPPIGAELDDDLRWLSEARPVPKSLADESDADRPAPAEELALLVADTSLRAPAPFRSFVASSALQSRVRSCTSCYLDLGDFPAPVDDGGWLIHFLSDQQWVLHWLLYCDESGHEAVVVTDMPVGFGVSDEHLRDLELDDEALRGFDPASARGAVCAESFSEFLYRFRIENELWLALTSEPRPLTAAEQPYVDHYADRAR